MWCDATRKPFVDAKFFKTKTSSLSGVKLLWILGISLSAAAICLDVLQKHDFRLSSSLTTPFLISALLSGIAGVWVVPLLRDLKTGQIIREEGPQAHLKKAGTPTMGGIFFIPVAILIALISVPSPVVWAASLLTCAYGLIGWIDDWQVLRRRSNKGISPRMKLLLQIACAVLFCLWTMMTQPVEITQISLAGLSLPLGWLFWPLAGFVLVAESNATNLTDGLDGLMAGTGAIAFLGLGALLAVDAPGLMVFCAAMAGACLGFLVHNHNPAKVFMGDTGSLALGGGLAAAGILGGNLFGLLIVTFLFFAETLSVIIQVSYYKATKGPDGVGKRFFKMAPLHHHFELTGWSEIQVVAFFYSCCAALALLAFVVAS